MREGSKRRRVLGAVALLLLVAGGLVLWVSRGGERVGPTTGGAAPKVADPKAGAALPEDARTPAAPGSTLEGTGRAPGMSDAPDEASPATSAPAAAPPPTPSDGMLPTRVVFLDAVSGREVPGVRWIPWWRNRLIGVERESSSAAAAEPSQGRDAPPPPDPMLANGDTAGLVHPWGIVVEPLAGWVCLGARAIPSRRMPRAREGRMTVLLHPEADVRVEILGPDGRVADGAVVSEAFVAGATIRHVREERAPDGTRRLRGIPFFAGEVLQLMPVWAGPGAPSGLEPPPAPSEDERAMIAMWRGPMPDRPDMTIRAVLRLDGPIGPGDHNETDNDLPTEESLGETPPPDPSVLGTVRLQLVDRDGKPVPGVRVAVRGVEGTTEEDGRVALERIEQGKLPVVVRDYGWTFPPTSVTVVGRQVTEVVVREIVGGDVEIFVRDTDGNPVPFAALEVGRADGHIWYDVDDAGIQRLDPYVDVRGRRVLTHQPPGTLRVRATLGTLNGTAEVQVVDRGRRVLPITVAR